jgi:hypothetical protein
VLKIGSGVNNSAWLGNLTINAGSVTMTTTNSLGYTGSISVTNNVTASLLLDGTGIALNKIIALNGSGMNSAGAIENVSGTNTIGSTFSVPITTTAASATATTTSTANLQVGQLLTGNVNIPANVTVATIVNGTTFTLSTGTGVTAGTSVATNSTTGLITLGAASTIGSDTGTLNIKGGISGAQGVTFVGGGTININTTALGPISTALPTAVTVQTVDTAVGTPTVLLGVASNTFVGTIAVNHGTLTIGDSATGVGSVSGTGAITLRGGTLAVDDRFAVVNNRLNAAAGTKRPITMAGGTLSYTANGTAGSSETLGLLTTAPGQSTITLNNGTSTAQTATLTLDNGAGLVVANAVLVFNSTETFNGTTNKLQFTTAPTLTGNIISRAAVTDGAGVNFATNVPTQTLNALTSAGSPNVTLVSGTTTNMAVGQGITLNAVFTPRTSS